MSSRAPLLLLLASALLATEARANGAFPSAGQILVEADPARLWVRTTFGFARSLDGGASFHLVCEGALGYSGGFHPLAALTGTGAIFMGLPDGLIVGRGDMCAFARAPELEGSFVADVSIEPGGRAVALVIPPNGARARVFASTDDVTSWAQLGDVLPDKSLPLTLDVAPSDPDVIYVSGLTEGGESLGTLWVSLDAGATWASHLVPNSNARVRPFIGAVDPISPGRVYLRLTGVPGTLLISDDFGQTFTPLVLTTEGQLQAFRLSEDGAYALYGGAVDGLNRLDTTSLASEPLANIAARCVTLAGDLVYACGEDAIDGFAAGRSIDGGQSFEPVLRSACIEGILPCDAASPVAGECEPEWPAIAATIGAIGECDGGAGGGAGATNSTTTSAGTGGSVGAGGAGAGGGAGGSDGGDGCACGSAGREPRGFSWGLVLGAVLLRWGRRRQLSPWSDMRGPRVG